MKIPLVSGVIGTAHQWLYATKLFTKIYMTEL
jgi:hypothetical protein